LFEEITFRIAEKTDIPKLVKLMNTHYNLQKDNSYFLWQYFDSYFPTISMCAFDDDNLIGITGIKRRRLENGAIVGFAMDALMAPKWRGTGLAKLVGEETFRYFDDLDLLCALPNRYWNNLCVRRFGWRSLCRVNSMMLHRNSLDDISQKCSSELFFIEKEQRFEKFKYDTDIRAWRFDRHPDYKYDYIRLNTEEFAVVKVFVDFVTGIRYGDIVAFECNLNNHLRLRELFVRAIMHLNKQEVHTITTWALPHTPLRKIIESLGFVEMHQERFFCVKILNEKYEHLYDFSRWHLVQADAEIY
jgi:hypothetical protein